MHRLGLLGMLTSGFEHELRNPLAFTLTNLQLADETMPDLLRTVHALKQAPLGEATTSLIAAAFANLSEISGMVNDARTGASRIHRVVESMGMLARSQKHGRARVPIASPIDTAVQLTVTHLRQRIRFERAYEEPLAVLGEETRLAHVFLALLMNVSRRVRHESGPQPEISISIRRVGPSVVVELLEIVRRSESDQTRSTRVDSARERGLDLCICRGILTSFGGSLEISHDHDGRHYRVSLPVATDDDAS
jgi:two-component system, NtrC family, sensor kinase